jgi:hypothetical protein
MQRPRWNLGSILCENVGLLFRLLGEIPLRRRLARTSIFS